MSEARENPFGEVIEQYHRMEPEGADTWNPRVREWELLYRLALYDRMCLALARCHDDVSQLRVLDVGCGNGRSTRLYLDLGLRPDQITGIDLRPDAIEQARRLHPGIRYVVQEGASFPVDAAAFDWISLCTVMSSIPPGAAREVIAAEVDRVLDSSGRLFYFDRRVAHGFAGGDVLAPDQVFSDLELESHELVDFHGRAERLVPPGLRGRLLLALLRWMTPPPTHQSCVLSRRKP